MIHSDISDPEEDRQGQRDMASVNLEKMSYKELMAHEARVKERLEKVRAEHKREVLAKVRAMVEKEGFTIEELFDTGKSSGRKAAARKSVGIPKYANPADPSQTWTGKGKRPNWLNALLEKGHSKDEFLIK